MTRWIALSLTVAFTAWLWIGIYRADPEELDLPMLPHAFIELMLCLFTWAEWKRYFKERH